MDLGSTCIYINTEECTARKLEVEHEQLAEEITMADDFVFKNSRKSPNQILL